MTKSPTEGCCAPWPLSKGWHRVVILVIMISRFESSAIITALYLCCLSKLDSGFNLFHYWTDTSSHQFTQRPENLSLFATILEFVPVFKLHCTMYLRSLEELKDSELRLELGVVKRKGCVLAKNQVSSINSINGITVLKQQQGKLGHYETNCNEGNIFIFITSTGCK